MQKIIYWLIVKLVTIYWLKYPFYVFTWGIDEHVDLYVISEESYFDRHRMGLKEETFPDTRLKNTCEST
jgi:hypothetical protein